MFSRGRQLAAREDYLTVRLDRGARRDLARLAASDAKTVVSAIAAFAETGVGDVKKLRAHDPPGWRLRVGRFRVLYRREEATLVVDAIKDRRDAYR
jgi:mRNA-degrading endonuclease RelE of RelBE toxin-antitoxin system